MRRRSKGFTLIELLIVVAIIGIIVAMGIMNLISAIQRAKQKRTMGDLRAIGSAVEAYATDYNRYPAAAAGSLPFAMPSATIGSGGLLTALEPIYLKKVPQVDGWLSWFVYGAGNGNSDYIVASAGRNGTVAATPIIGVTTNFNDDIIFADGQFFAWPEGAQVE